TPEFRQEVRLRYLKLLNGIGADVAGDASAPAGFGEIRLIVVVAFNSEVVEDSRLSPVAKQPEAPVARDARSQKRELIGATSVNRQVVNLCAVDERAFFGLDRVNNRRRGHCDCLTDSSQLELYL